MSETGPRGLVFAAPASGSGKTVVTLGVISAWRGQGKRVAAAKTGPDYIDTAFLSAAASTPAINLDTWAMRPSLIARLVHGHSARADLIAVEGVMGLFDGGAGGAGSTAELAAALGLPVVLAMDASRQAQSVAALAQGFAGHSGEVAVAGVILNRVGSARHERLMRAALDVAGIAVFGAIPRAAALELPSRHLGLVQADETAALDRIVADAAAVAREHVDLESLAALARPVRPTSNGPVHVPDPPGQRIAMARDRAFGFAYTQVIDGWRGLGAEVVPFSPLADEAPDGAADAVILPGGYPELHAGVLASNARFIDGLRRAAAAGAIVYGECGGYMVLGEGLTDASGMRQPMAGLLGLETSFEERRLSLGYRRAVALDGQSFAPPGVVFRGHEFHYATVVRERGQPLYSVSDAEGNALGTAGLARARVAGCFVHAIDVEEGPGIAPEIRAESQGRAAHNMQSTI